MENFKEFDEITLRSILSQFFHQSFNAILISEPNVYKPVILYVNPAFCKMSGYSREELIGKTPKIFQGEKTNRNVIKRLHAELLAGNTFYGATTNYKKNGEAYPVEWNITPVKNENNEVIYYISIQKDLSNLKAVANRLKRTNNNFRGFLKEISQNITEDESISQLLSNKKEQLTENLLDNSKIFNSHLRTEEKSSYFEDDQFFDFSDNDAGALAEHPSATTQSATEYLELNPLSDEDIAQLIIIIDALLEMIDILEFSNNKEGDLIAIITELKEVANTIFYLDDFVDISSIFSELATKLEKNIDSEFPEFVIETFASLIKELKTWTQSIFIQQSSKDIHEFDANIISAAKQLMMFLPK